MVGLPGRPRGRKELCQPGDWTPEEVKIGGRLVEDWWTIGGRLVTRAGREEGLGI